MANPPPALDSLSPIVQIVVLVGSAFAGGLAWMFGQRGQGSNGNGPTPNVVALENQKLRTDLETVLARHREAIDNRITQNADGVRLAIDRLSERQHAAETALAIAESLEEERKTSRDLEIKLLRERLDRLEQHAPRRGAS